MDDEERRAKGMTVRREVLGDAHVGRAVAGTTEFTADYQDLITRYAWGEIWTRPGLGVSWTRSPTPPTGAEPSHAAGRYA